jgi:hypothetical protein
VLIGPDSPLRRPPSLSGRERLFVDGMRYAVDMADYAHYRLVHALLGITSAQDAQAQVAVEVQREMSLVALMDAWSIVDSVDRLRGLLGTRGDIMKGFAPFNAFRTKTADTRVLRNNVDHLGQKLDYFASRQMPVHGVLGWVAQLPGGNSYIGLFKGGTFIEKTDHDPMINPLGKRCAMPVGLVTLTMGKDAVCLSHMHDELQILVAATEPALQKVFGEAPPMGGDLTLLAQIQFDRGQVEAG